MHNRAKILTPEKLEHVPVTLPPNWWKAAGLLRRKQINPVAYQRKIRSEWERRLKKLERDRVSRRAIS